MMSLAKQILASLLVGLAAWHIPATGRAADVMPANDLRDFRVGDPIASLTTDGLMNLACADAPDVKLDAWSDFRRCPQNAAGLHAISFMYDSATNPLARVNDNAEGTKVAGQPVLLQLWIGDDGIQDGLSIVTDPSVRLYAHRRAYLFGLQARARYGDDGWQCSSRQPTPTEQPIGTTFVKEHCEKSSNGRRFVIDRDLHRDPGRDLREFVSSSSVLILKTPAGAVAPAG